MKTLLLLITVLFAGCKDGYKQDLSRQKSYSDEKTGAYIWVADSNCLMKMYVHDTVYKSDIVVDSPNYSWTTREIVNYAANQMCTGTIHLNSSNSFILNDSFLIIVKKVNSK